MPLFTPLFDGNPMFGTAVRMRRSKGERGGQRNTYGGLDGTEFLDMGARGWFTTAEGRFTVPTPDDLNQTQLLWESYQDGNAYQLRDRFGNEWPNVMLVEFEMVGDLNNLAATGGYTQAYRAKFEHL